MTQDKAIEQIEEEIAECDKGFTNQGEYLNQGCKAGLIMALSIIKQIDEPTKPKTNLERIRQMSGKELAQLFTKFHHCCLCPAHKFCGKYGYCVDAFKAWLNSEVEE